MKKIIISSLLVFTILVTGTVSNIADANTRNKHKKVKSPIRIYKDVVDGFWAKDAIEKLSFKNILNGLPNGNFQPYENISKEQLATILVRAFNLPLINNVDTSYSDTRGIWSESYINATTELIKGVEVDGVKMFNPKEKVKREDIIYAIIKASKLNKTDKSCLEQFSDKEEVLSSNASDEITTAVNSMVINGKIKNGTKYIDPKGLVTRAEVATILINLNDKTDVKIKKYEKNKPSENDTNIVNPIDFKLESNKTQNGLYLKWDLLPEKLNGKKFRFYKVVASISNNDPVYPKDGWAIFITDINKLDHHISLNDKYERGDFTKFTENQEYYIRITAVYEDKNYKQSNIIKTTIN